MYVHMDVLIGVHMYIIIVIAIICITNYKHIIFTYLFNSGEVATMLATYSGVSLTIYIFTYIMYVDCVIH